MGKHLRQSAEMGGGDHEAAGVDEGEEHGF